MAGLLDIVCVSVMDWQHPFMSSRHHLMRELSKRHRVLFVNNQVNPVTAWRGLSPERRGAKWRTWWDPAYALSQVDDRIWVFEPPPVWPMGTIAHRGLFEVIYRANQAALRQAVQGACQQLGMRSPVLWISFNLLSSESLIGALNESLVLYHCTDEISAMPRTSRFAPLIEQRILRAADLTLTSSPALQQAKAPLTRVCHLVPNGADTRHFNQALDAACPVLPALTHLKGPVLGFMGHLEERIDFALLDAIVTARPDWHLVLAGPVVPQKRHALAALARHPNVHVLGLLDREALPAFLKGIDVALVPFVSSPQTRAIYPLKLHEYLAAGKAVVMTDFADLPDLRPHAVVASGVGGYIQAIAQAIASDAPEQHRIRARLAAQHDWGARATTIDGLIADALANRHPSTACPKALLK